MNCGVASVNLAYRNGFMGAMVLQPLLAIALTSNSVAVPCCVCDLPDSGDRRGGPVGEHPVLRPLSDAMEEVLVTTMKLQRAKRDLTQAQLADLSGITRKSINAIESGRMVPSTILALKLARTLGVTVEELFSIEPAGADSAI